MSLTVAAGARAASRYAAVRPRARLFSARFLASESGKAKPASDFFVGAGAAAAAAEEGHISATMVSRSAGRTFASFRVPAGVASKMQPGNALVARDGSELLVVAHRPPLCFLLSRAGTPIDWAETGEAVTLQPAERPASVADVARVERSGSGGALADDAAFAGEPLFSPPPEQSALATIQRNIRTGVRAIDALAPVGRGQNMLLVTADEEDECDLLATILNGRAAEGGDPVDLVFAAASSAAGETLQRASLAPDSLVVRPAAAGAAAGADADAEAVLAREMGCALAAVAVGDRLRSEGRDALVVVQSMGAMQRLWKEVDRTMQRFLHGEDAQLTASRSSADDSEMRAFFSKLVHRAGAYNGESGGGSLTVLCAVDPSASDLEGADAGAAEGGSGGGGGGAFAVEDFAGDEYSNKTRARLEVLAARGVPLTAETLARIGVPLPGEAKSLGKTVVDSLVSLCDGQVVLSPALKARGEWPPVDPRESLTRIGIGASIGALASSKALLKVASRLRLELALDTDALPEGGGAPGGARAAAWRLALQQEARAPTPLEHLVAVLCAVGRGKADDIGRLAADGDWAAARRSFREREAELLAMAQRGASDALAEVRATGDLSATNHAILDACFR